MTTQPPNWAHDIDNKFTPTQKAYRQFIVDHPFVGFFLGMGGGKTIVTLAALLQARPAGHSLLIAPKAIADTTWLDEIDKWNLPINPQHLSVNLAKNGRRYTRQQRYDNYEKIFSSPPALWIINRELLTDLVDYIAHRKVNADGTVTPCGYTTQHNNNWPFATVIVDESQSFSSAKAQRWKALKKVRPYISRMILLSGTPAANSIEQLWPQIYLLDQGQALGATMKQFHNKWFVPSRIIQNQVVEYKYAYPEAENEIYDSIKHFVISGHNPDLPLPDMHITDHIIHLDKQHQKWYREFHNNAIAEFTASSNTPSDDATSTSTNVDNPHHASVTATGVHGASVRNKLLQFTAGCIYISDDELPDDDSSDIINTITTRPSVIIHNDKLRIATDIVHKADGPVIIATRFISDQQRLVDYMHKHNINAEVFDKSRAMLDRWNKGGIDVLLIHPKSAGHGLNFQQGGHTLIWFNLPDSLEEYLQATKRLHRPGQINDVEVHRIIVDKTYDAALTQSLNTKDTNQQRLLDALLYDPSQYTVAAPVTAPTSQSTQYATTYTPIAYTQTPTDNDPECVSMTQARSHTQQRRTATNKFAYKPQH